MEKWCNNCKQTLDVTLFNKKRVKKDGSIQYQPYCRECNRVHSRAYYQRNLEHHRKITGARTRKIEADNYKFIYEYLSSHPCVDCKTSDVRVLEFDHVRGTKYKNISNLKSCSKRKIMTEIAKCDVRCANCHRIRTAERSNNVRYRFCSNNE